MREVKRNSGDHMPYTAAGAEAIRQQRIARNRGRRIDRHELLQAYIRKKLTEEYWSPMDIAGRLKECEEALLHTNGVTVSHESIYQWIYEGNGQLGGLYQYLHYKQRKRKPQYKRKQQKTPKMQGRTSIHDRPGIVEERKRFGDWESDTMVFSKQQKCFSVQY